MNKVHCKYCKNVYEFDSVRVGSNFAFIYSSSDKIICIGHRCFKCKLLKQKNRRKLLKNKDTKLYEKTPHGFLMRCFRNMKSRTSGVQKQKFHLYQGKVIGFSKEEFYSWSISNDQFKRLFSEWEKSGYERRLTPSVDRINSEIGYEFHNIEWVTHSENSRRGSISRNLFKK